MPFNPLLFVAATAGAGAIAGGVAAQVFSNGLSANVSNAIGNIFTTRREQNFQSAEWLNRRQRRVEVDNSIRFQDMMANRERIFGGHGVLGAETTSALIFPDDLGKHFMKLSFYLYKRDQPNNQGQKFTKSFIFLPIPANLRENVSLQYNHSPLGFGVGAAEAMASNNASLGAMTSNELTMLGVAGGAQIAGRAISMVGASAAGRLGQAAQSLASASRGGRAAAVAGAAGAILGAAGAAARALQSENLQRAIGMEFGMALNPFSAVTFDNVHFRTHSFSWKLMPRTEHESRVLVDIKNTLLARALPVKNQFTFDYPNLVVPEFFPSSDYLFKFKPSFITSVSLDHAPSQVPAFYKTTDDKFAPVESVLTINLIETVIMHSKDPDIPQGANGYKSQQIPTAAGGT